VNEGRRIKGVILTPGFKQVVEASTIGLPPGCWPAMLIVGETPLALVAAVDDGSPHRYVNLWDACELIVVND
jgi:hypothetical protein